MHDEQLFPLPPAVIHIDLTYVEGMGWHMGVISRLAGESWSNPRRTHYDRLTHAELLEVVWSELATRLSIS